MGVSFLLVMQHSEVTECLKEHLRISGLQVVELYSVSLLEASCGPLPEVVDSLLMFLLIRGRLFADTVYYLSSHYLLGYPES